MKRKIVLFMLVSMFGASLVVVAQDSTCPAIVSDALAAVDSACDETGRNQACYGNLTLTAEAQEGVDDLTFETPGDIANVADIQSLALSPLDEAAGEWGVSLMKLQANLPDTLPGQNVTMLLFGDVEIENAVGESSDDYAPMQAFYFRSGVGDAPCEEAPESGILIQTPKGQGQIMLRVNDVDISLGSTVFLQAVPGDALYVNLLEGQAKVTAFDETQTVPAGAMVSVPLDDDGIVSGPPSLPEAYPAEMIDRVVDIVAILPDAFPPAAPLTVEAVEKSAADQNACRIQSNDSPNIRSGPGTNYPVMTQLADQSLKPLAQAVDSAGFVWYQTGSRGWIRSDVVAATGDCESLPVVTDLPPTPTSAPVTTGGTGGGNRGGGTVYFNFWDCERNGAQYNLGSIAGQTVHFSQGVARFPTTEEAEAARGGVYPIVIDGTALAVYNGPVEWHSGGTSPDGWGFGSNADWLATPGTHAAVPYNIGGPIPCTLIVEP